MKTNTNATRRLDPTQRDLEPVAGAIGTTRMFADRKSIDEANRTIDFVCSSATVDRYGEIVEPAAFRASLPAFLQNPAFPFGHTYDLRGDQTPTVGRWLSMRVEGDRLVGTAYFKPRGIGEECWQDYREGNLTSVSVGFIARAWEMRELTIDGVKKHLRVFTEADLLECSAVLIPANPEARLRAAGFSAPGSTGEAGDPDSSLEARVEAAIERALNHLLDVGRNGPLRTFLLEALDVRGLLDLDDPEAGFTPGSGPGDTPGGPTDLNEDLDLAELRALLSDTIDATQN
ncbi:MAG: HK97 family phage prohead protease [Planctomycetota bacterium]